MLDDRRTAPPADLLFHDVRLIDPATGLDEPSALLVRNGHIVDIGTNLGRPDGVPVFEGRGAILCPGLVDMRASLGEPGFEYRETVASAARAASSSGITTLAALPDSRPALDDPALVHLMTNMGQETGALTVLPYGAVTRGCRGEELAEIGLLRVALSYARGFGAMIVQHPEDPGLAAGGAATEGEQSTRMGLPGIPAAAEAIMVARDIRLAQLTGGTIHFAHVSTAEALELIRRAKHDGLPVTCDTAPPYFDLNETAIGDFRTYAKLSPPLRPDEDRLAVCAALADGTIDAIASDHQPRDADDKRLPFALATPGGAGLATLLGVTLAQFHGNGLPLMRALDLLTASPARVFGIHAGTLAKGAAADLCLFDLERAWKVEAGRLPGKSQNTPFDGRALEGQVIGTWKAGRRVFG
jgi:dihydroorotase